MLTEQQIRMAQAQAYEDIHPDPKLSGFKAALAWYGGLAFCIVVLSGAGYGLWSLFHG